MPAICAGVALLAAGEALAASYTQVGNDAGGTSSFTNPLTGAAAGWSGTTTGAAPTAGNTYSTTVLLRGPNDNAPHTFPGDSLTINAGGRMLLKSTGTTQVLTVNNFILNGGTLDQATTLNDGLASTLAGNISVTATSGVGALAGETLTISAKISGSDALNVSGATVNAGADTGTVILTNANTAFTGGLTLGGGVLVVNSDSGLGTGNVTATVGMLTLSGGATNNYLGDSATLSLANGTSAALNFTGTDLVGSLVLNGATQLPGIYNAATNPAFFSGTGSITVVPEPSSFAQVAVYSLAGLGGLRWMRRRRRVA